MTGLRTIARTLALTLVLVAACSDDGPEAADPSLPGTTPTAPTEGRVGPFAVMADSVTRSGELMSGIPIASGSVLLGPAFPDRRDEGGFEALLLVTGDPVAVFNDYIDAAAGLGMRAGSGGGCVPGLGTVTCARRVIDPADGEALSVLVERRPLEGGFVSHAALFYEPPGTVDPEDAGEIGPSAPTSLPAAMELPEQVPEPPAEGWNEAIAPGSPPLSLVDGSSLAGPPGPCPCGGRGWSAVVKVDGSPDEAIAAWARELGVDDPEVREGRGEGDVRVADLGLVPEGIVQLRTVTDDRGTWLLVKVSLG